MHAERLILETDDAGRLIDMPELPPRSKIEAIFFVLAERNGAETGRRSPPRELAGKLQIYGDIVAPVVDERDWDALR